ncbi:hypothetical protein ZHAS_00005536 [Anopheles sinensis]|uniref:Uncharacterized protein n=1 Tax=Anopheles sinensis TaxID=74873 RepID=A0A084VJS7_ANOSI|nr:hypothetical protein ZHAS_00005536 [Anopheles sinensis]
MHAQDLLESLITSGPEQGMCVRAGLNSPPMCVSAIRTNGNKEKKDMDTSFGPPKGYTRAAPMGFQARKTRRKAKPDIEREDEKRDPKPSHTHTLGILAPAQERKGKRTVPGVVGRKMQNTKRKSKPRAPIYLCLRGRLQNSASFLGVRSSCRGTVHRNGVGIAARMYL